jgi:hypothetical protein
MYSITCAQWREKSSLYRKLAIFILIIPLVLSAVYLSWFELVAGLFVSFGAYLMCCWKIDLFLLKNHKVDLLIDDEQFARHYDSNFLEPVTIAQANLVKSKPAAEYVKNTLQLGRKLTQLDLEIVLFLNTQKAI